MNYSLENCKITVAGHEIQTDGDLSLFGVRDIRTVLADPPWEEKGGGKCKRGADRHYDVVKTKDLPALMRSAPQWDRLCDDAHMYMWVTNTFLCNGDALWLAAQLGFRPITLLTWAKNRSGIGQYFFGQTEHILFCVRGKPGLAEGNFTTLIGRGLIEHPKNERGRIIHSRKPELVHEMIEQASPGKYLELFARLPREGWETWGNEVAA